MLRDLQLEIDKLIDEFNIIYYDALCEADSFDIEMPERCKIIMKEINNLRSLEDKLCNK